MAYDGLKAIVDKFQIFYNHFQSLDERKTEVEKTLIKNEANFGLYDLVFSWSQSDIIFIEHIHWTSREELYW